MAVTENLYTGDGSTVLYSFTFPYLATNDVKVSLDGSNTTAYSLANATQVQLDAAPASGVAIRVYRDTSDDSLSASFFPGAAIKSADLNNNFTQNLYVTQESNDLAEKATTTANTAKTTADSATTAANTAVSTANAASTAAASAVTTANTASTNATNAVNTANTASTNATSAVNTANAASAAVSNAVLFTLVANVAAIPGSPSNNDYIEIGDSTGIQSFSPLSSLPSGFVGSTGLTVRLRYTTSGSTWVFMSYFANDSESRYLTTSLPVVVGDSTNGSGQITLNCENNSHGIKIKGPPHSAGATYTLTLPNNTGTSGQFLATNGSGVMSWSTMTQILVADGGNFDSGASLVTSSSTFDGGSF